MRGLAYPQFLNPRTFEPFDFEVRCYDCHTGLCPKSDSDVNPRPPVLYIAGCGHCPKHKIKDENFHVTDMNRIENGDYKNVGLKPLERRNPYFTLKTGEDVEFVAVCKACGFNLRRQVYTALTRNRKMPAVFVRQCPECEKAMAERIANGSSG